MVERVENLTLDYAPFYSKRDIAIDLATRRESLVSWLIIEPSEFSYNSDITIRNVKEETSLLKNANYDDDLFLKNYFDSIVKKTFLTIEPKDIGFLWLMQNPDILQTMKDVDMFRATIFASFNKLDNATFFRASDIIESYDNWVQIIDRELRFQKQLTETNIDRVKNIMSLIPLKMVGTQSNLTYERPFVSEYTELIYLFNLIQLNEKFPYAYIKLEGKMDSEEWYKTHIHSTIKTKWISYQENIQTLDIFHPQKMLLIYQLDNHTSIPIYFGTKTITYEIKTESSDVGDVLFVDIQKLLGNLTNFTTHRIEHIKKSFFMYNLVLNKAILLDIVFNHPELSYFLTSDEKDVSGMRKTTLGLFFMRQDPKLNINLSMHVTETSNVVNINLTKGKNKESIIYFMEIFPRLMSIYNKEYDTISELYTSLIPSFIRTGEIKTSRFKIKGLTAAKLAAANPELFVSGWVSKCLPARQPQLATEEEISSMDIEDGHILKYSRR